MNVVADGLCLLQQSDVHFLGRLLLLLVTGLQLVLLLEQIIGVALGLLDLANLFLECVDLGLDLVGGVLGCAETRRQQHSLGSRRHETLTLSVILEHGNDLVDDLFGSMASTLTLLDLLDVAAALGDKVVDVQHGCVL